MGWKELGRVTGGGARLIGSFTLATSTVLIGRAIAESPDAQRLVGVTPTYGVDQFLRNPDSFKGNEVKIVGYASGEVYNTLPPLYGKPACTGERPIRVGTELTLVPGDYLHDTSVVVEYCAPIDYEPKKQGAHKLEVKTNLQDKYVNPTTGKVLYMIYGSEAKVR